MGALEIVPYDPRWPGEFAAIAVRLRPALGELALRIDHIGSTAVPGLAAKDVIDVQITVPTLDCGADLTNRMTALGYGARPDVVEDHVPEGWQGDADAWRKLYFASPPGRRKTNTHVRAASAPNQRYALLFRDYLRAHPAAIAAYSEVKRRLAMVHEDTGPYSVTKDPIVDLVIVAAEEWAAETGWMPGPADA